MERKCRIVSLSAFVLFGGRRKIKFLTVHVRFPCWSEVHSSWFVWFSHSTVTRYWIAASRNWFTIPTHCFPRCNYLNIDTLVGRVDRVDRSESLYIIIVDCTVHRCSLTIRTACNIQRCNRMHVYIYIYICMYATETEKGIEHFKETNNVSPDVV